MAKKMKSKESISENIANLLNSAPCVYVEDVEVDETYAKVTNDLSEDFNKKDVGRSKLRAQNIDLLESIDKKYAGTVSSRKRLRASSESEDQSDNEFEQCTDEDNVTDEETMKGESLGFKRSKNGSSSLSGLEETNFKHFRNNNVDDTVTRGSCVRNQLNIWESLLETRIQLQKCLSASNKLPIAENFKELSHNGGEEFKNKLSETKNFLGNILDKMLMLQSLVVKKFPETKKLFSEHTKLNDKVEDSDEEITSDDSMSQSDEENENHIVTKQRKNHEYEEIISKRQKLYKNYRNSTIQKWSEKSRIGTFVKNNSNSQTILNQIEHIMSDKSKLIKKTHLKRSNYLIIGETEIEEDEIYNENIYDDDDFYHQLLRELIEFKSSDITDPVQLGRQWIQLQNMRSKMKRKIDTRATKGRKIRYAVHTKLVNFMAPIDYRNSWTEEAKKELFSSLFGKKQI